MGKRFLEKIRAVAPVWLQSTIRETFISWTICRTPRAMALDMPRVIRRSCGSGGVVGAREGSGTCATLAIMGTGPTGDFPTVGLPESITPPGCSERGVG